MLLCITTSIVLPPRVTPTEGTGNPTETAIPTPTATPTCTDFDIRLGDMVNSVRFDITTGTSRFSVSGRIEVCVLGSFYSICDEGWGQEEARVICNVLNYSPTNYRKFVHKFCILHGS